MNTEINNELNKIDEENIDNTCHAKKSRVKIISILTIVASVTAIALFMILNSYVKIPDIINKHISYAEKLLDEVGITYELSSIYSNDIDRGTIIEVRPNGKRMKRTETLHIVVSYGVEPYEGTRIPNLGKYLGISLDKQWTQDGRKMYRYHIGDVNRASTDEKDMVTYGELLEELGYTFKGELDLGQGTISTYANDDVNIRLIFTEKYVGVSF